MRRRCAEVLGSVSVHSWSGLASGQRAQYLNRIADLIQGRLEEFARAESLDQGKPLWLARTAEIPRAVENFRFFAAALTQSRERYCKRNDLFSHL